MAIPRSLVLLLLGGISILTSACNRKERRGKIYTGVHEDEPVLIDSTSVAGLIPGDAWYHDGALAFINDAYRKNEWVALWHDGEVPTEHARVFVQRLKDAGDHGLNPKDYRAERIEKLMAEGSHAEADALLTTEFYRYTTHMLSGLTAGVKDKFSWLIKTTPVEYADLLTGILTSPNPEEGFKKTEPQHGEYQTLKKALALYRKMAEGIEWSSIDAKKLSIGDKSPEVLKVRERLTYSGDYVPATLNVTDPQTFDPALELGVKAFQGRYGLEPDGVVGGETKRAMEVSPKARIRQIILNMERWRLLPQEFDARFILVNIAGYRFHLFDDGKEVMNMRVIVGDEFTQTPIFADTMQYIVFAPYWNVPASILENEVIPAIQRKGVGWLTSQDMEVVKGNDVVDPYTVPWNTLEPASYEYRVRQRPGAQNSLGFVKFIFPNNFNVYLHDTPNDWLFQKAQRHFSHGCIRLERPQDLAVYLLSDQGWDKGQVVKAMAGKTQQQVNLKKPIPVYLLYFTAWADENGSLSFREDIYGYDKELANAYLGALEKDAQPN